MKLTDMKDLTHYFQSPDKEDKLNLSEKYVVEEVSPLPNAVLNQHLNSELKYDITVGSPLQLNQSAVCETSHQSSDLRDNCESIGKRNRNIKLENVRKADNKRKRKIEQSEPNNSGHLEDLYGMNEKYGGTECTADVSPNAFQVLMSTQQVFGTSNSGKKECPPEDEDATVFKHAMKKKIKENLDEMYKRKLNMEDNLHAVKVTRIYRASSRKRVVRLCEDEPNPQNSNSSSEEMEMNSSRKRKKTCLNNNEQRKRKRDLDMKAESGKREVGFNTACKVRNIEGTGTKTKKSIDPISTSKEGNGKEDNCEQYMEVNMGTLVPKLACNVEDISAEIYNDISDSSKKSSNILNYFNKIDKVNIVDKKRKSSKIKVTVDVHFPVASAGKKSKATSAKKNKKRTVPEIEDDIQLIESELIKEMDHPITEVIIKASESAKTEKQVNTLLKKSTNSKKITKACNPKSEPLVAVTAIQKNRKIKNRMRQDVACSPPPKNCESDAICDAPYSIIKNRGDKREIPLGKKVKTYIAKKSSITRKPASSVTKSKTFDNISVKNEIPTRTSSKRKSLESSKVKDKISFESFDSTFEIKRNNEVQEAKERFTIKEKVENKNHVVATNTENLQISVEKDDIAPEHTSHQKNTSNEIQGKNSVICNTLASEEEFLASEEVGIRRSLRKRSSMNTAVTAVDEETDDFDSDSDDDYHGDTSDEDCDDESIFKVRKKKSDNIFDEGRDEVSVFKRRKKENVAREKCISVKSIVDQKLVLKFLKNAKGTLNRKMALNDPKNFPVKLVDETGKKSTTPKLAPVFTPLKGKKTDKEKVLARKIFLESGVPEAVKKMMEIQKLAEEQEHVIFPSVSHVQQKDDVLTWCLPDACIKFTNVDKICEPSSLKMPVGLFTNCQSGNSDSSSYNASQLTKIKLCRSLVRDIKIECPDFPVYRTFKRLYKVVQATKTDIAKNTSKRKRRQRKNLSQKNSDLDSYLETEGFSSQWTDKYHPRVTSDIMGNSQSVKQLKKWLEMWVNVNENTYQKTSGDDMSSGNEFINDASDDECRRNVLPKNTAVLVGPNGSGKTMSLYTVACELGYKVLEVNAATKRTGRRIISELLEATQSHQVIGKGEECHGIRNFFSKEIPNTVKDETDSPRLSLILVDDVDVVFEEDEGFVSALSTLVSGSKRPVVFITSDPSCSHLSRFLEKSLVLSFKPVSCKFISVWLQLVSLVEGIKVNRSSIEELLRFNNGDVRKTLLQLQFWVLSGGDNHNSLALFVNASTEKHDDTSNSSWNSFDEIIENETSPSVHSNCLSSFLLSDIQCLQIDRGKLWWNIPKLTGLKSVSCAKKRKHKNNCDIVQEDCSSVEGEGSVKALEVVSSNKNLPSSVSTETFKWKSSCSRDDVTALVKLADTLSVVDKLSFVMDQETSEPDQCFWEKDPSTSLSLVQDMRPSEYGMQEIVKAIRIWLISKSTSQCSEQLCPENNFVQVEILQRQPPMEERSWRLQQHNVTKQLEDGVPVLYWPQRRAVAMDYISSLRSISRFEQERELCNDKRNNRFSHYLKGIGVHTTPDILEEACNVLRWDL